ncbi:hypothetical protein [Asaia platycodi]|uniref:hypothetical protein n=1 Tax=Asaia platycodi TaxID=610243 RepID=UPI000B2A0B59|nr:hypothetical protein [Asaia platycodi]
MRLSEILHRAGLTAPTCAIDPEIMDITADSRAVVPGMIFAALPGVAQDGARFIPQAWHRAPPPCCCRRVQIFRLASKRPALRPCPPAMIWL